MEAKSIANLEHAIRITFGIVHASLLTLFSFGLALLSPALTHFLFSLFGCILAPGLSLLLTLFCNGCVRYIHQATHDTAEPISLLTGSWIPPFGVFLTSLLLLPLEMMPSLGWSGPLTTLAATFVVVNFVTTLLLQVYVARRFQADSSVSSASGGSSGPT